MSEINDERVLSEEYKKWKKNVPFMYDFMLTRVFEYPSKTIQWLNDDVEKITDDYNDNCESIVQRICYGTNTGHFNNDNYLIISSIKLPVYIEQDNTNDQTTTATTTHNNLYNIPTDMFGSFYHYNDQLEPDFMLFHNGPVHCARSMVNRENIIATRNSDDLFIYDIKDCLKDYSLACETSPILSYPRLHCQTELNWNPNTTGLLLTSYDRTKVAIWDLNSQKKRKTLQTKLIASCSMNDKDDQDHVGEILDASWHQKHAEIFGAATLKGNILLWDIRSRQLNRPSHHFTGHKGSAYQLRFSPFSEYVFITSGSDGQIAVWDLRNLNVKLHSIQMREERFHSIKWSPHCETLFGALSNDRKVYLFDLDKILDELLPQEVEYGPSSLTFIHSGHTSKVNDFDWNQNDSNPLMICSVSDDNVFQIWQMSSKYVTPDTTRSKI